MVSDHGMNAKMSLDGGPNVRYLCDELAEAGLDARVVLPITDPYVVHHGALGSIAWVYVSAEDRARARATLAAMDGVEAVLNREAAAAVFELPPDRIGDLAVCADATTVLGKSEAEHDLSAVGATLRSHGGLHERRVPLVISCPLREDVIYRARLRNSDLHHLLLNESP